MATETVAKFGISFGALMLQLVPIKQQITSQGFRAKDAAEYERWQSQAEAIELLAWWKHIAPSVAKKARTRLFTKISAGCVEIKRRKK